jgi:hypothetical protein
MTAIDRNVDYDEGYDEGYGAAAGEVAVLRAEVERLRAALLRIHQEAPTRLTVGEWTPVDVSEIARAALGGEEGR